MDSKQLGALKDLADELLQKVWDTEAGPERTKARLERIKSLWAVLPAANDLDDLEKPVGSAWPVAALGASDS